MTWYLSTVEPLCIEAASEGDITVCLRNAHKWVPESNKDLWAWSEDTTLKVDEIVLNYTIDI